MFLLMIDAFGYTHKFNIPSHKSLQSSLFRAVFPVFALKVLTQNTAMYRHKYRYKNLALKIDKGVIKNRYKIQG